MARLEKYGFCRAGYHEYGNDVTPAIEEAWEATKGSQGELNHLI